MATVMGISAEAFDAYEAYRRLLLNAEDDVVRKRAFSPELMPRNATPEEVDEAWAIAIVGWYAKWKAAA